MTASNVKDNLSRVLSTHEGRECLREIMQRAGVLTGFTSMSISLEPLHMAYHAGRKSLGEEIRQLIMGIDPKYLQLITNKSIEEQAENGRNTNGQPDQWAG